jgi:hypothetical protein
VEELLKKLWQRYTLLAPMAIEIKNLIDNKENKNVINDHIALRTLKHPKIGLDILGNIFITYGYQKCENYNFEAKRLNACHFEHPNPKYPKIFISELRFEELSSRAQEVSNNIIGSINVNNDKDLILYDRTWKIEYKIYEELYKESEYLAWFYVFGFIVNHFTIFANDTSFKSIHDINIWLEDKGYILNASGGKIKGEGNKQLEQSSTMAQKILVKFDDGTYEIPSCFYEFAKRYPQENGKLYSGFIESSANKIFESTNQN